MIVKVGIEGRDALGRRCGCGIDSRPLKGTRTSRTRSPLRARSSETGWELAAQAVEAATPREVDHEKVDGGAPSAFLITPEKLPDGVFIEGSAEELMKMYRSMISTRRMDDALFFIRQLSKMERSDVLSKVIHKGFLKLALMKKAVRSAVEFVELLPTDCIDCRTYNMLVSVCVRANDLENALSASARMQERGLQLDLPMYTNLISAYGARGDVHQAFQLYGKLKEAGLKPDNMVAGALANACSFKLKRSGWGDRRASLVLLERALSLQKDLESYGVMPDTTLSNVLVTCAGRAGQLQRAFDLLQGMRRLNCKADSVTYCSLIDACIRAGRRDLAKNVYTLALKEVIAPLVMSLTDGCHCVQVSRPKTALYTAALESCMCGSEAIDSEMAFEIYRDAQASGRSLDVHFFSTMIRVAGKSGMPELALAIEDNMRVQGIEQSTATCSAMIAASISSDDLELASKIYTSMVSKSIYPNLKQFTNLMQAYARARRVGDMIRLVEDMVSKDITPDDVLADVLLTPFKDASMADIAFTIFTILKAKGVPVTERVCFTVLDICHIQLKALRGVRWERPDSIVVPTTEGLSLVKALAGDKDVPEIESSSISVWMDRSIAVYQQTLSSGVLPSLKLLSKLLSCLRIPHRSNETDSKDVSAFNPFTSVDGLPMSTDAIKPTPECCFDKRVIQFIKEAIQVELIPAFNTDERKEINLTKMPPAVAEAYVFTLLEILQFRCLQEGQCRHGLIFKVLPFDPKKALLPKAALRPHNESHPRGKAMHLAEIGNCTSLAVVSVLRRLRLWHNTEPSKGRIIISSGNITKWMHRENREENDPFIDGIPGRSRQTKLAHQQRDIRMMNEMEPPMES